MIRARLYLGAMLAGRPASYAVLDTLTSAGIQGATLFSTIGLWQGVTEPAWMIELLGDYTVPEISALAELLRVTYAQEAVLWTREPVHTHGMATGWPARTDEGGE